VDAVPAVRAEPAELGDVNVDQLAQGGALVAADHASGGAVHPGQPVQAKAAKDPVHGRDG